MEDSDQAARLRQRAKAIGDQGRQLRERARAMPAGRMREMLEAQAVLLIDGGRDLELKALALEPAAGSA
jgi:hypothetical protein